MKTRLWGLLVLFFGVLISAVHINLIFNSLGFVLALIGLEMLAPYGKDFKIAKHLAFAAFVLGLLRDFTVNYPKDIVDNYLADLHKYFSLFYNLSSMAIYLILAYFILKGISSLEPELAKRSKIQWYSLLIVKVIAFADLSIMIYTIQKVDVYPYLFIAFDIVIGLIFAYFILKAFKDIKKDPIVIEKQKAKSTIAFKILFFVLIIIWLILIVPSSILALWAPMASDGLAAGNVPQKEIDSTHLFIYTTMLLPFTLIGSIVLSTISFILKRYTYAVILLASPILHIIFFVILILYNIGGYFR